MPCNASLAYNEYCFYLKERISQELNAYMKKNHWMLVLLAGIFEVMWVIGLKHAAGWLEWSATAVAIYASFHFLMAASSKLPAGTVYAIFTGIGTAGTVFSEIIFFGAPVSWDRMLLLALLLIGIIGLKTVTDQPDEKGAEGP